MFNNSSSTTVHVSNSIHVDVNRGCGLLDYFLYHTSKTIHVQYYILQCIYILTVGDSKYSSNSLTSLWMYHY